MSEHKEPSCYATLDMRYNTLVLPLEDAAAILQLLAKAQKWDTSKYNDPRIVPIPSDAISLHLVSKEEYQRVKVLELIAPAP